MARKGPYSEANTPEAHETLYQETKTIIENFERELLVGRQSHLRGKPIYIWEGGQDPIVPNSSTAEQKRYFEDFGANVSFNRGEDIGHWFQDKAPLEIGKWCYNNSPINKAVLDYEYTEGGQDFLTQGAWRKFDQQEFAREHNLDPKVEQWGFYYVPNNCLSEDSHCLL